MFARRRRLLPRAVQYLLILFVLAWTLRSIWFLYSTLFSSLGEDENKSGPARRPRTNGGKQHRSVPKAGGLDEDEDDDDDFGSPIRSSSDNNEDDAFDAMDGDTAASPARRVTKGSLFFVQRETYGFWNEAFREHKSFKEVTSWSESQIRWFLGGTCAVRSSSADDRTSLACEDYGLRLLYRNAAVRYAALSAKVVRLARTKNKRCLIPDDFTLRPLTAFDRDILSRIPETETVLVRDKEDPFGVKLVAALEAYAALEKTDRIVVERFIPNPMLMDGRKFSLRAWVIPLQLRAPLLGYFALGDAAIAKARLSGASDQILAHVPTDRSTCWEDLMQKGGLPPRSILLPHIKRVSLFVLTALADHEAGVEEKEGIHVAPEPFCLDFELDENFKVYLVHVAGASDCGKVATASKCKNTIDVRDVVDVMERFVTQKGDLKAEKRIGSLELLVDEATFSSVADELCLASPSPFEQYIRYHHQLRRKIESEVLRRDGRPKTKFAYEDNSPAANKCPECGYEGNDVDATHCDVCGVKLRSMMVSVANDDQDDEVDDEEAEVKDAAYRNRLVKLFERYDPARLSNVDVLLQRYRGEEDALIVRLSRQYEALSKSP